MAMVFALIGGVTGFFAALVTLALGHGFWQAMMNYWQVGTFVLLALIGLHILTATVKSLGYRLEAQPFLRNKPGFYGVGDVKSSLWKQAAANRHHR